MVTSGMLGGTVARNQRALKLFLRIMLPVFTLGGFGAVWGLVRIESNQEQIVSAVWSQDGRYRASVVRYPGPEGCGRAGSSFVLVERRDFFFKTGEFTPFCLDGAADRISLSWKDSRALAIGCGGCDESSGYADQNWGKLHFSYDLDKP